MFEEILAKLGSSLSKHAIPYMIIGGQAVLIYGEPRLTRDIDVTLGVNIDHLNTVLSVLKELSLKPIPKDLNQFVKETMVLPAIDRTTGIRVDFIFSFSTYETEAIRRGKKIKIFDNEVVFVSPEDLIIHKIFAGRPRDIEDVKSILIKNLEIDKSYIQKWLKVFDKSLDNSCFTSIFEKLLKQSFSS